MASVDDQGVPKTRPVPQQHHIEAAEAEERFTRAVRSLMAEFNLTWPEALKRHGEAMSAPRDETPAEEKAREKAEKVEEDAEDVQPRPSRKKA